MADGGKVIIKIDGDVKPFKNSMETAKDGLNSLNKSFAAIGAVGAAGFAAATKAGMSFESQMSSVQAISGATSADMELLTAKAKQMGIESAFSATDSGKALEYMAMAGWKTEDMLNGLEGVMNLAAASGEDLGMVSDIVTDSMTAFGLAADQSGRFADVLAAASSNSNTNVSMMGETFKYVAPVAGSLGYNIEDTAVAIGLMANAGIKGSQAGTALRSTLTRLAKPTGEAEQAIADLGISITDASGEIKPFNLLIQDLRERFSTLSEAEKAQYAAMLAGQEGMSGMLAIVNSSDEDFNKLTEAINNSSGAAKQMADTKLDNLQGQLTLLGSSFEGLGIAIYEKFGSNFQSIIESMIDKINDFIEKLSSGELDGILSGIAAGITGIGTALLLLNVAYIIQDIINAFNGLAATTKLVSTAQAALNLVMSMNPFVLIATLIAGVVAALVVLWNTNEDFRNAVISAWELIKETAINVWNKVSKFFTEDIPNAFQVCIDFVRDNWKELLLLITNPIAGAIALLYKLNPKFRAWVDKIIEFFKDLPKNLLQIGKDLVVGLWNGINDKVEWLKGKVKGVVDKIKSWFTGKDGFDEHSPSKWSKKVFAYVIDGAVNGVVENKDKLIDAIGQLVKDNKTEVQKVQDEMNKELLDSEKNYNAESERLKDSKSEADKKYLENLKNIAEQERKIYDALQKDIANSQNAIMNSIKTFAEKAYDSIDKVSKAQESYANKLKGYVSFYNSSTGTLSDYRAASEQLKLFSQALEDVQKRGNVPIGFFNELREMPIDEGIKFATALANAPDKIFNEQIDAWSEYQKEAEKISKTLYSEEAKNAGDEVEQAFKELNADLDQQGQDNAEAWGNGFLEKVQELMPNIISNINAAFSGIVSGNQYAYAGAGTSNTYYSTYNIQPSSGESTQQQLWALKNSEFLKEQRGY